MARNWTPEERAKHAAAMRKWKPWEKSTGPKTEAGKAASSQNALTRGLHTAELKRLRKLLALQKKRLHDFNQ